MAKPRPEKKPGPAPPTIRVAGRVGDLLLARVLGLGRAHFPFAPRGSTVSRRQRHCGEPWCHAAYPAHTSVESARHEWAPKSPRYSTTAPTRTSLEAEPGTAHGHQAGSKSLNGCRSTLQGRIVDTAWRGSRTPPARTTSTAPAPTHT